MNGEPRSLNGEPRPFNDEPRPLNGEPRPLNGEPRPLNGEPTLLNGEPRPLNGEPRPLNGEPRPLNGQPRPLNGEPRPLNGEPRPLNGEPRPLNGEPRPLNGEPRPLNGESRPQAHLCRFHCFTAAPRMTVSAMFSCRRTPCGSGTRPPTCPPVPSTCTGWCRSRPATTRPPAPCGSARSRWAATQRWTRASTRRRRTAPRARTGTTSTTPHRSACRAPRILARRCAACTPAPALSKVTPPRSLLQPASGGLLFSVVLQYLCWWAGGPFFCRPFPPAAPCLLAEGLGGGRPRGGRPLRRPLVATGGYWRLLLVTGLPRRVAPVHRASPPLACAVLRQWAGPHGLHAGNA